MATFHYTKTHEYIREEGGEYFLGISTHAQAELGDITYVELPEEGAEFKGGESCCTVESVKAVAEVYAPFDFKVAGVNSTLENSPELINKDAEGAGWIIKLIPANAADVDALMDAAAYAAMEK